MGWPSTLTYREIIARNVPRSVSVLAHYGDVSAAENVFAREPSLADDPEALEQAAGNGHEEFVRLILRYQPDLPKRVALVARTGELTELLFAHGMDPNHRNWLCITPLHQFAERGDIEKAAIFIDHGADLHARDEDICSTPLGWASKFGQILMVEFLLRRGAKPNVPDDPPWATPLAWATRRRHDKIAQLLSEYEKTGALPVHHLGHYETLAKDLVEAYRCGDDDVLRRVADHFQIGRQINWDRARQPVRVARFRRYVRERLGTRPGVETESEILAPSDAQLVIARSHGFESWAHLLKQVGD